MLSKKNSLTLLLAEVFGFIVLLEEIACKDVLQSVHNTSIASYINRLCKKNGEEQRTELVARGLSADKITCMLSQHCSAKPKNLVEVCQTLSEGGVWARDY